ncbi:MAG: hypothetical protein PHX08_08750 [Lachnospiraceae bacterium]|nr:hypothetical protein [Lachnospiraceae bacterium]
MNDAENVSEYEKIRQMNYQLYIMKKNKKALQSKWKQAREMIEKVMKTLSDKENKLKDALDTSVTALLRMQVQDENVPLKKIKLDKMNGEPVWVVSIDHDGRWGIVHSGRESVFFLTPEGTEEELWFDNNYIFRYKKQINDYSKIIEKYGLKDE